MKNLIYVLVLIMLFPLRAFSCYGEFCSTNIGGVVYDFPTKVINQLTVPELTDPTLILNDPKGYFQKQPQNGSILQNAPQVTICNGKKCIVTPKLIP